MSLNIPLPEDPDTQAFIAGSNFASSPAAIQDRYRMALGQAQGLTPAQTLAYQIDDLYKLYVIEGGGTIDGNAWGSIYTQGEAPLLAPASASTSPAMGGAGGRTDTMLMSHDGRYAYVHDITYDRLYQYELSTPYVCETATLVGSISEAGTGRTGTWNGQGAYITPDGTRLIQKVAGGTFATFDFGTPYDITTLTWSHNTAGTAGSFGVSIWFTPDGLTFFVAGATQSIRSYTLVSAFTLPATLDETSKDAVFSDTTNWPASGPYESVWNADGTRLYSLQNATVPGTSLAPTSIVISHAASTAWDVTTLSYESTYGIRSAREGLAGPLRLWTCNDNSDLIFFGQNTVQFAHTLVFAAQGTTLNGGDFVNNEDYYGTGHVQETAAIWGTDDLYIAGMTEDGATVFFGDVANQVIHAYPLLDKHHLKRATTAPATASQTSGTLSTHATQRIVNGDIVGGGLYFIGAGYVNSTIYCFDMPSAYTVTAMAFADVANSLDVSSSHPVNTITDINVAQDGTYMIITGTGGVTTKWDMSTPYDVSTATLDSTLPNISTLSGGAISSLNCALLSNDGSVLVGIPSTLESVVGFTLSTPFDLSTATGYQVLFATTSGASYNNITDLYTKTNGTVMPTLAIVFSNLAATDDTIVEIVGFLPSGVI